MTCGGKDSSNLWHGLAVEEMPVDEITLKCGFHNL